MTIIYVILGIIAYLFIGGVYLGYDVAEFYVGEQGTANIVLTVLLWPKIVCFRLIMYIIQVPYKLGKCLYETTHGGRQHR